MLEPKVSWMMRPSTAIWVASWVVMLMASLGLFRYASSVASLQLEMSQNLQSNNRVYARALQEVVQRHLQEMDVLATTLSQRPDFSEAEFIELSQKVLWHSSQIQAIEWLPKVLQAERMKHEALMNSLGYLGYQITEKNEHNRMVVRSEQPFYYPVMFVEPYMPNQKAHGFDVMSRPFNKIMIMQLAAGAPFVFSPPFKLIQEKGNAKSVLLYRPVQDKNSGDLIGVALFILHIESMLAASQQLVGKLETTNFQLKDITLYTVEVGKDSKLQKAVWLDNDLYHSKAQRSQLGMMPSRYSVSQRERLVFGETQWEMLFNFDLKDNVQYQTEVNQYRQNLLGYLLLSIGLGVLLFYFMRFAQRLSKMQAQLTFEQERVQALFHRSSDLYFLWTQTGTLVEVNQKTCDLLGYSREYLMTLPLGSFWVEDQRLLETFQNLARGQYWESTLTLKSREGSILTVECLVLTVEREGVSYFSCLAKDLTGYKNQVQALELAVEQSEKAGRLKTEFLANMSHELRTPLHGVLSFATLGETRADSEKLKSYFSAIRVSGERLLKLLTEILELAKLESTQVKFDFRKVEFNALVAACVREQSSEATRKNIRLEVRSSASEIFVICDAVRIHQVVANLLSNAIKFTPEYGLIELRWSITLEIPSVLSFTIYNEGEGIEPNDLEAIFDKFVQAGKHANSHMGTGLGLSICREIVTRHQGHIWAESQLDQYARFTFTFPITPQGTEHEF